MRAYAAKIELLSTAGEHLRWIPGEFARAMIAAENAVIANQNGKVRRVRLIGTAQTTPVRLNFDRSS